MTSNRNTASSDRRRQNEPIPEPLMDQAYGQRARGTSGWEINKTVSISVIVALIAWTVSGIWTIATQNATINGHSTAIAQLQANEKENDKQRVEILLHLSNMDQSLKDILNYGMPRNTQVMIPTSQAGTTNTPIILQQAQPMQPENERK
jgi:hypothetical protein